MKPDKNPSALAVQTAQTLLGLSAGFALLVYAFLGSFTRYWADDYCFSRSLNESGNVLSATLNMYQTWSNRFTTVLLVGVSEWFGPQAISYLPATLIFLWVIGLSLCLYQTGKMLGLSRPAHPAVISALLLAFFTILQAPNRFQAVYWRSGSVTYFAPLVFYAFGAALILRQSQARQPSALTLTLTGLIFFLAGGLSETTLALQIGFLSLALCAVWLLIPGARRRAALALLSASLLASIVALLVVFNAPGNSVRLTSMPERASLATLILLSLQFSLDFISTTIRSLPIPTLLTFFSGFALGLGLIWPRESEGKFQRFGPLLALAIPLAAYGLMMCLVAPSIYVYGKFGYPEARALFPTRFIMTLAVFFEAFVLSGVVFRKAAPGAALTGWLVAAALLCAAVYPAWSAKKELAALPQVQTYAANWDQRDQEIHSRIASGQTSLTLHGIESPGGLADLNKDPAHWINRCAADFYGLQSINVFEK